MTLQNLSSNGNSPNNAPTVSVVMCALNEAENLPQVLPKIPPWISEVVLVDGHSTDDTVNVAKHIRPDVKVVIQSGKGKGDALRCGYQSASSDIIVTLDADGATAPDEIQNFVHQLTKGYDFVKGSRLKNGRPRGMKYHRWIGNLVLVYTARLLFNCNYTDMCSGYNAFWKKSLSKMSFYSDGFEMEQELNVKILKDKLRVVEIFHSCDHRQSGVSKVHDGRQGFKDLFIIILTKVRCYDV